MRKDERGQSIVETALILPILVLLISGILDIGRVTYSYAHLHMAAQETVRKAGLGATDTQVTEFARNYVHLGESSKLIVEISPTGTNRRSGEYVTVKLKYPIKLFTPFVSSLFPSPFYAETNSTIRVE
ncbi:pilus assembly protein TadE [Bacillus sp. FJAT-27225]|uniref:TadE/TadG family type IV pilus assembly protein n=1 Tax=Bacillus sp. FJAT-27225 TaxID=1743144 RepID=UPI00080C2B0F|nr:TadE/TadG family type IV pilus assembly protein [Bacillus sp. FJAT-27225]OCA84309.1 pilus assembly protein TadE [Bacillus sp. FJAT-27225]